MPFQAPKATYHKNVFFGRAFEKLKHAFCLGEGSLQFKLPTIWTDGKAQLGRNSGMEKIRREKIRDGQDQEGRQPEKRRKGRKVAKHHVFPTIN